jgi:hypothetical protein
MGRALWMLGVLRSGVSGLSEGAAMMIRLRPLIGAVIATLCGLALADNPHAAKATSLVGPDGVKLTVRMQGPYNADVPLQFCPLPQQCAFRRKRRIRLQAEPRGR